jgi:hypothetical protein
LLYKYLTSRIAWTEEQGGDINSDIILRLLYIQLQSQFSSVKIQNVLTRCSNYLDKLSIKSPSLTKSISILNSCSTMPSIIIMLFNESNTQRLPEKQQFLPVHRKLPDGLSTICT